MKYLSEINAFRNYLKTNSLEAITQALWYVIIDYHNSCNWERWITIDNQRLMAELSISEKTLIKHRNMLIQAGLIEYKSQQRKKSSGKYKLLSFELGEVGKKKTAEQTAGNITPVEKADNETTVKNTADWEAEWKAVQGADWKADCSDLNRIDKTRLETNTTNNISLVANAFQQNGFGTINSLIKEMLIELLEQYPIDWIIEAMKVAVKANVRSLSYVEGILKKWNSSGGMKLEKDNKQNNDYDPYAHVEVIK